MDEIESRLKLMTNKIKTILFEKEYGDWIDISYDYKVHTEPYEVSTIIIYIHEDHLESGELKRIEKEIIRPFTYLVKGKCWGPSVDSEFILTFRNKKIVSKEELENIFKSIEGIKKFSL